MKPKEKQRRGFNGPTTPSKLPVVADIIWGTPQGSEDILKQLETVRKEGNNSIRDFISILTKAGMSLDEKNSKMPHLEEEKAVIKAEQAAKEPTGRVPVQFDPNKAFPNSDQIITAQDRAEKNVLKVTKGNKRDPCQKKRKKSPNVETELLNKHPKSQKN